MAKPAADFMSEMAGKSYKDKPAVDDPMPADDGGDLPPEFTTAAKEAFPELDDAGLKAFYSAIEACKGDHGLAIMIGGKHK